MLKLFRELRFMVLEDDVSSIIPNTFVFHRSLELAEGLEQESFEKLDVVERRGLIDGSCFAEHRVHSFLRKMGIDEKLGKEIMKEANDTFSGNGLVAYNKFELLHANARNPVFRKFSKKDFGPLTSTKYQKHLIALQMVEGSSIRDKERNTTRLIKQFLIKIGFLEADSGGYFNLISAAEGIHCYLWQKLALVEKKSLECATAYVEGFEKGFEAVKNLTSVFFEVLLTSQNINIFENHMEEGRKPKSEVFLRTQRFTDLYPNPFYNASHPAGYQPIMSLPEKIFENRPSCENSQNDEDTNTEAADQTAATNSQKEQTEKINPEL